MPNSPLSRLPTECAVSESIGTDQRENLMVKQGVLVSGGYALQRRTLKSSALVDLTVVPAALGKLRLRFITEEFAQFLQKASLIELETQMKKYSELNQTEINSVLVYIESSKNYYSILFTTTCKLLADFHISV